MDISKNERMTKIFQALSVACNGQIVLYLVNTKEKREEVSEQLESICNTFEIEFDNAEYHNLWLSTKSCINVINVSGSISVSIESNLIVFDLD